MSSAINEDERPAYLPEPLSMTNEERDIDAFRGYLRGLTPEALWDIYEHLDDDRYPRRHEAVRREMSRRRLLYFPLYTPFEGRLRSLFFAAVVFALLAAILHGIPALLSEMAKASQNFGGDPAVNYNSAMRRALSFSALTARELETLTNLCAFFRGLTELCLLTMAFLLPLAAFRAVRHRLRPDVVLTGLICAGLAFGLLRYAMGQ